MFGFRCRFLLGKPVPRRLSPRVEIFDTWMGSPFRSEEHTSELQSHSDLVCRLLLENATENTATSTLSLHDALPISGNTGKIERRRTRPAYTMGLERELVIVVNVRIQMPLLAWKARAEKTLAEGRDLRHMDGFTIQIGRAHV